MKLFGTSGIRRIFDAELLQIALKVGIAVGNLHNNIIIGTDTRTSKDAVKYAVISGLLAAGARCSDAGIVSTPTLAMAAGQFDAGVMITASHNPPNFNGIKLWNPDGSAFNTGQQQRIEAMVAGDDLAMAPRANVDSLYTYAEAVAQHISRIREDFPQPLKARVVIDCNCGAGAVITPHLLKELGCEVIGLNCDPSGLFPHEIETTEANLGDLMTATKELGADLGIAHDGDADRMMAVDDQGRFIPGDKLLVILAWAIGAQRVITTVDASAIIEDQGFEVTRTQVGDSFVSIQCRNSQDFGGEASGSWIFPKVSRCPDGIYAAALITSIASQQSLSELVDQISAYPLLRGSLNSAGLTMADLEERLMTMKPQEVNKIDGLKLIFDDGWLLIRPSGTEPKIRITAEARTEARVRQIYNQGLEVIQPVIEMDKQP